MSTTEPNIPVTQGQAVMASSLPVAIASDQSAVPVTLTSTTITGNPAVNVAQVNGNTTVTAGVNGLQAIGGNVANAATDSGNPVKIGGIYNTSAPTLTNGQRGDLQLNVNGAVQANLYTLIAGEDLTNNKMVVEQRNSYTNVPAGQATTVIKASAGFLHSITFNSAATATNVTTVYDNASTSGTIIAKPAATTATVPTTLTYDVSFANGLTIITTTANGSDMTVSWR